MQNQLLPEWMPSQPISAKRLSAMVRGINRHDRSLMRNNGGSAIVMDAFSAETQGVPQRIRIAETVAPSGGDTYPESGANVFPIKFVRLQFAAEPGAQELSITSLYDNDGPDELVFNLAETYIEEGALITVYNFGSRWFTHVGEGCVAEDSSDLERITVVTEPLGIVCVGNTPVLTYTTLDLLFDGCGIFQGTDPDSSL